MLGDFVNDWLVARINFETVHAEDQLKDAQHRIDRVIEVMLYDTVKRFSSYLESSETLIKLIHFFRELEPEGSLPTTPYVWVRMHGDMEELVKIVKPHQITILDRLNDEGTVESWIYSDDPSWKFGSYEGESGNFGEGADYAMRFFDGVSRAAIFMLSAPGSNRGRRWQHRDLIHLFSNPFGLADFDVTVGGLSGRFVEIRE